MILSLVTLCVLGPWSIRSLQKYIVENTSYRGRRFEYVGEPDTAFWKTSFTLRLLLPPFDLLRILGASDAGRVLLVEMARIG